ncbi:rho guanine nucleotide exchange factor 5 isoform X2 [Pipistrellus kuhlii]|uniref:rho guanine nucleotide exchange factor 5 isoform X2 n=1 Tax=Pipistrellus kuhlii TaxID=59472 RepID=UPI00174F10B9|nr:rho guanine nucleotide exchange factor 5 isoform X2 [Pipistrellus kuhlii]XP_036285034.1 rho guanine nucleotide exchange factor 5 isoform X2 [Pipistrellus kuhlii]
MEAAEPRSGAPGPIPVAEFSDIPEALMRSSQPLAVGPEAQEGRDPSCKWTEERRLWETQQRDERDVNDCAAESMTSFPKEAPSDVETKQENLMAEAWDTPDCQEAVPRSLADRQARTPAPPERWACPVQGKLLDMAPLCSELRSRLEVEFRPEFPSLMLGTGQAAEKEEASPDASARARCSSSCEEHLVETDLLQESESGAARQGQELQESPGKERLVCPQKAKGQEVQGQEEREAVCSEGLLREREWIGEQVNGTQGGQMQDDMVLAKQGEREGPNEELGGVNCDEWEGRTRGQEDLEVGEQKKREVRGPEESRVGAQCQEYQSLARRSVNVPGRQERQGLPGTLKLEEEAEDWDGAALGRVGGERISEEGEEHDGLPILAPKVYSSCDLLPDACNARIPGSQAELRAEELCPIAQTPSLEPIVGSCQSSPSPSFFPDGGSRAQEIAQDPQPEGSQLGTGAASSGRPRVASASAPETSPNSPDSAPSTSAKVSSSRATLPAASPPIAIPRTKVSLDAYSPETSRASFPTDIPSSCGASETLPAALPGSPSAEATMDPHGSSNGASPQSPLADFTGASQHLLSNSFPGSHRTQLTPDLVGRSLSFSHSELPQRPPKHAIHVSVIPRRDRKSSRDFNVIPEFPSSLSTLGHDSGDFTSDPHRPGSPHSSQPWGSPHNSAFAQGSPVYGSSPPPVFVDTRLNEPPPPAPPKKRHVHPSAVERDSHLSAAVPTLRHCSYPPLALSSGLCGPPKVPLPEIPDPHVARQYRPLPSTPDDSHHSQTSFSQRLRYNKPLPPTPDLFQPQHSPVSHNSTRIYRPLPPVPVINPLNEPPPLPPKARGRNKSIQGALTNSGGQAKPRPVGQEWAASSSHSGGRTSWPPAMGRSTDSLASTSRRKSEISPDIAFSNMTSLPSPSSPTSPWTVGLQEPISEPGHSEESEASAKRSLRRMDPQEGANGLRRSAVGRTKQTEKPSHPHLEKASSWPHRRDPGRPPQDSAGQAAISGEGSSKHKGWHRQGLRRPSILPDGSSDTRGPTTEKPPGPSDTIVFREKKPKEVMGGFSRRCSKLINSSQLLYQEYSDVVLNKEIQSQQRPDSLAEASGPPSPRQPRKVLVSSESYLQRLSMASRSSLWQEIPVVRNSTVLLSMTHEDQKLQEAKFELIVSEASYLRSLNIAVDHFQHSAQLRAILSNQDQQWLFSRLQDVRDVSATFLSDLEENFENNIFTFHVCDVVLNHASHFRRVYLPYVTNQTYQERTFQTLLSTNSSFREVLEKLESDPICQRLSLKSFLILPFQRITRLKLLLQNILKRTQPGSSEEAEATKAHHALEELIRDCNNNVQRMRRTEELIYLSQKIEFECKIFPLISQSRWLVKSGELAALESSISPGLRRKLNTRPVHLHLFNDCLLLSRPREGGRFLVFDHAPFSSIRGEKCEMKLHGPHKNLFRLFLLHNTQGTQAEFLFSTETQSEKLRWISALAMPREELDLQECYDSPQVQCLRAYKPRENDELALEKADVVMVTQQSSDGWLEGMRLSDGERGWFPVQQVEFISNPEVRARNLKEAQRVKTAKLQLVEQQT